MHSSNPDLILGAQAFVDYVVRNPEYDERLRMPLTYLFALYLFFGLNVPPWLFETWFVKAPMKASRLLSFPRLQNGHRVLFSLPPC